MRPSSSPPPDRDQLAEIIASPATHLLVARGDDGTILGSLTLVLFRIPTGLRAWIEDVVVDEGARGRGVGEVRNALTPRPKADKPDKKPDKKPAKKKPAEKEAGARLLALLGV